MTEIIKFETSPQLMEEYDFVTEAVKAVCKVDHIDGQEQEVLETLRHCVWNQNTGIWLQKELGENKAFGAATILTELSKSLSCWLWLIYGKPGANLRMVLEEVIIPWARERGAVKLQASNFAYSMAKDRWFSLYGLQKKFEVYERRID